MAEPESGVFAARIHVQMRKPGDPLPAPADLHDLVRFQLEGPEIDSTIGLTFDDLIDPSSIRIVKVELTRIDRDGSVTQATNQAHADGVREGRRELSAELRAALLLKARENEQQMETLIARANAAPDELDELACRTRASMARARAAAFREAMDLVHQHEPGVAREHPDMRCAACGERLVWKGHGYSHAGPMLERHGAAPIAPWEDDGR